jgi:H+/gluconate symporter-like permease
LITSILVTNSFIVFSPDEDSKFYFSGLTSTLGLGAALVIAIIMVYRYKRCIKKQEDKRSQQNEDGKLHYFYDNNKVHFSICLFFAFWLAASVNWIFEDQEAPGVLIADVLYYLGYASFGYFLYRLYYHFFRKEFEPFILILIAVIILVPLIFIVDTIVSTLRLLSIQTVDISVVIVNAVYPILDAIVIFPLIMIFWAVRRINSRRKNATLEEIKEKDKSPSSTFVYGSASMWILLLFIAMLLSAAGDSGFAYTSAFDVTTVQNYIWIWNIFYNSDHLCLAAALIGYKHFFSLSKIDVQHP